MSPVKSQVTNLCCFSKPFCYTTVVESDWLGNWDVILFNCIPLNLWFGEVIKSFPSQVDVKLKAIVSQFVPRVQVARKGRQWSEV